MEHKLIFPAKEILDAGYDGTLSSAGEKPFRDILILFLKQEELGEDPYNQKSEFIFQGLRLETFSKYFKKQPHQIILKNSRHTGTGLVHSVSFLCIFDKEQDQILQSDILITSENNDTNFKIEFLCQYVKNQKLYISWGRRDKEFVYKSLVKLFDPNGKGFRLFLPKQTDEINHLPTDEEKLERISEK